MREKTIKIDTWLPIFSGYYHSIFDESDSFIEHELSCSDNELKEYYPEAFKAGVTIEFFRSEFSFYLDYRAAENECSEYIANGLMRMNHSDIIESVIYQKTVNPKYYNFSTDSINVEIEYNPKKLKKFIKDHKSEFKEYIESKYTSCSGFISHYSNNVDDWINEINNDDLDEHSLGSVLEFVIKLNHGDSAEIDLYDESNCHEGYRNGMTFDHDSMIVAYKKSIKK